MGEHINKKRMIIIEVFFIFVLSLLIARLSFIQVVNSPKYKDLSTKQQSISLNGIAIRGTIYDRNRISLTNGKESVMCYIEKEKLNGEVEKLLDSISAEKLNIENAKYYVYESTSYNKAILNQLKDKYRAFIFLTHKRYSDQQPAAHLIGYINKADNTGQSGLENDFDSVLNASDQKMYVVADGVSRIITGLGIMTSNDKEDGDIVTTLDYNIQTAAEGILKEYTEKGSLVVLEAKTGNILAGVSLPSYDPNNIGASLNSDHGELMNKSIQSVYPPGSIFKIVVAAAALENHKIDLDTRFFCKGYQNVNDIIIKCSSSPDGGHGSISLLDAFAKSCNSTFIQIGESVGGDAIIEMSKKLGLGQRTMSYMKEENVGNLPSENSIKGAGIGNLSIGQGELLVTPMQVAKLTQIIANKGNDTGIHLVSEVIKNKGTSKSYINDVSKQVLSGETCQKLNEMMKATVTSGTANNMNLKPEWTAAGKTGSAEAANNGNKVVHGWFTGYIPADDPKYVITVFAEEGKSGRGAAVPVFGKMAEWLYTHEDVSTGK